MKNVYHRRRDDSNDAIILALYIYSLAEVYFTNKRCTWSSMYRADAHSDLLFLSDTPMVTSLGDIGVIKSIKVDPRHQISRGQCLVSAVLTFFSAMPGSLHCEAISVSLEKGSTQSSQRKDDSQREIFQRVSVIEQVDYKQDGSLNAASIILPEGLKALRRTESAGRGRKNSTPLRKDFTQSLTTRNVVICPGNNVIELDWTVCRHFWSTWSTRLVDKNFIF